MKPSPKRTRILSYSNLTTIYRCSLSMRQNYHNDFRNTLVYFTIINSNWVPSIHLATQFDWKYFNVGRENARISAKCAFVIRRRRESAINLDKRRSPSPCLSFTVISIIVSLRYDVHMRSAFSSFFFFLPLSLSFYQPSCDIVTTLSHELIKRSNDKESCIILLRNVVITVRTDLFVSHSINAFLWNFF